MTLTTTPVGRLLVDHPDFNFDAGTGLHDTLRTLYTKLSDNIGCRYFTRTITNGSTATFTHNYKTDITNLRVYLYTVDGSGNLAAISSGGSPDLDDFVIAPAPLPDEFIGITIQNNTGSDVDLAVLIYQAPLVEKLTDLQDVSISSPPVASQILQYDGNNFVPSFGINPVGSIIAYNPGYYSNSSNGSFTLVGPTTNDAAGVNSFLNSQGYYVCDGSAVNNANSPIWVGAGRYLPNLSDSRFLMGSTAAGAVGGNNSSAHDHTYAHTHSIAHTHTYAHTHGTDSHLITINLAHSHTVNDHSHNITPHAHGRGDLHARIDINGPVLYMNQIGTTGWTATELVSVNSAVGTSSGRNRGQLVAGTTSNNSNIASGGSTPGTNSRLSNYNASHSHSTNSQNTTTTSGASNGNTSSQSSSTTSGASFTDNRPQYLANFYIIRVF